MLTYFIEGLAEVWIDFHELSKQFLVPVFQNKINDWLTLVEMGSLVWNLELPTYVET